MITLQQERVILRCADNLVTFHWPINAAAVTVSQSLRPNNTTALDIDEAAELFYSLLDAGAY